MANYGGGIFLPSETAYSKDPNRFNDVLAAEGNKEAKYLAEMDQFFAQLEETKREFDITTTQRTSMFEQELALNRDKLAWQSEESALDRALRQTEIDINKQSNEDKFIWQSKENALDRAATTARMATPQAARTAPTNERAYDLEREKLDMLRENNAFYRSIQANKEGRVQDAFEAIKNNLISGVPGMDNSGIRSTSSGQNALAYNEDGSMLNYSGAKKVDDYDYGLYNDWNL